MYALLSWARVKILNRWYQCSSDICFLSECGRFQQALVGVLRIEEDLESNDGPANDLVLRGFDSLLKGIDVRSIEGFDLREWGIRLSRSKCKHLGWIMVQRRRLHQRSVLRASSYIYGVLEGFHLMLITKFCPGGIQ